MLSVEDVSAPFDLKLNYLYHFGTKGITDTENVPI